MTNQEIGRPTKKQKVLAVEESDQVMPGDRLSLTGILLELSTRGHRDPIRMTSVASSL